MKMTRLDIVIEYLKVRLEEMQEKEPHATITISAYEDVIYDLAGGMVGK